MVRSFLGMSCLLLGNEPERGIPSATASVKVGSSYWEALTELTNLSSLLWHWNSACVKIGEL
jgi:hypothetical protein